MVGVRLVSHSVVVLVNRKTLPNVGEKRYGTMDILNKRYAAGQISKEEYEGKNRCFRARNNKTEIIAADLSGVLWALSLGKIGAPYNLFNVMFKYEVYHLICPVGNVYLQYKIIAMKTLKNILTGIAFLMVILQSCAVLKGQGNIIGYEVDPVCGMKVAKSEAFTWKYKGTEYYFDSYNCKVAFKMNPEKFLEKQPCASEPVVTQTK